MVFRSLKKTRKSVCASFTTVCNSSLTYTTYNPSHRSHTIIPLSNHHTIIILKSYNLRNICSPVHWHSTKIFPTGIRAVYATHVGCFTPRTASTAISAHGMWPTFKIRLTCLPTRPSTAAISLLGPFRLAQTPWKCSKERRPLMPRIRA